MAYSRRAAPDKLARMADANFLAFSGVAAGMIILPGADFTVVVRNALAGRVRGAMAGIGVVCGLILHTTIAVVGLAAVVVASPGTLIAIRYAGAAYLMYLGGRALYSAWASRFRPALDDVNAEPSPGLKPMMQGFLSNALNPKAPLLFLSIMPQFVSARGSMTSALIMMSLIVIGFGLLWFPLVAFGANYLGQAVSTNARRRAFDAITGAVLVGFAAIVLVAG